MFATTTLIGSALIAFAGVGQQANEEITADQIILVKPTAAPVSASQQADQKVINDPTRLDWEYYGAGYKLTPLRDPSMPKGAAVQVEVKQGEKPFVAGTNIAIGPVVAGRDYVIRFWARALKSNAKDGMGRIFVRFLRNAEPYPGFGDTWVDVGPDWKEYEVHAKAPLSIDANAVVGLQLAGAKQTLQLGQAIVAEGVTTLAGGLTKRNIPDPVPPQLVGKGTFLNDFMTRQWVTYGDNLTTEALSTNIHTEKATLMRVSKAGAKPTDAGVNVPIRDAIAKGDKIIVAVLARARSAATADNQGMLQLRMQLNKAPYPGFGKQELKLTPNWRLYQWKFVSDRNFPAGGGEVAIHAGLAQQEAEIGPVYVIREP